MSDTIAAFQVLVVEDEPSLRATIVDLLEFQGYTVAAANNGTLALQCVQNHLPDLIVSDVMMPEMDGYQLIKYLRSMPSMTETPIVLLSGMTTTSLIEEGLASGVTRFIRKPFALDEFLQTINQILDSK